MRKITDYSVGARVIFGNFLILSLVAAIGFFAISKLDQIEATVVDLAENLAQDQYLADKMISKILLARFYANKFVQSKRNSDLERYHQEIKDLKDLLARSEEEITKKERVVMLKKVEEGVGEYVRKFSEIESLVKMRQGILRDVMDVQGPIADAKLEALRASAFKANDSIAAFYAANAQRALLLMRLDAFKYLEEGNVIWADKFELRFGEFFESAKVLNNELQNEQRRRLAGEIKDVVMLYNNAFKSLAEGYVKQNELLNELNMYGPEIRETASTMSESVEQDFHSTRVDTRALVAATDRWLAVLVFFAVLIGLFVSVAISRSVTRPLKKIIGIADAMTAGKLEPLNFAENKASTEDIATLATRRDEMGQISHSFLSLSRYFREVVTDIETILSGFSRGELEANVAAEYRGDFYKIQQALMSAQIDLKLIVEDILRVTRGLAEGRLDVSTLATYQGDFVPIQKATEVALENLRNQDWMKIGLNELNKHLSGELDLQEIIKEVIDFLCAYLDLPVGVVYLSHADKQDPRSACLKFSASYGCLYEKEPGLGKREYKEGEGLVGQMLINPTSVTKKLNREERKPEKQTELISVSPKYVSLYSFLYEGELLGIVELGSYVPLSKTQHEYLILCMNNIGVAVNTAMSRQKMKALLFQSQNQSAELKDKQEELSKINEALEGKAFELQKQQDALKEANIELERQTQYLEAEKEKVREKNRDLELVNKEVKAKAVELTNASQYKTEFLANMSHELRSPLNSLLILSELMAANEEGNLTEKQVEVANTIHGAGTDLLQLINEILNLAKIESGKETLDIRTFTLKRFLETLERKIKPLADSKNIIFEINVSDGAPEQLVSDESKLSQVLTNLLSNAVKFTEQGSVTLNVKKPDSKTSVDDKCVEFEVVDTGIGIPEEKVNDVFNAFVQADGSTSRKYGGTGLGLTISRQLAELLGGVIHVSSEVGKGSIFCFRVPMKIEKVNSTGALKEVAKSHERESTQEASQRSAQYTQAAQKDEVSQKLILQDDQYPHDGTADTFSSGVAGITKKALIIDDDKAFALVLDEIAHKNGFDVIVAHDGGYGLQLAKEHQPDCIILDVSMPQVSGMVVMEKLMSDIETRHIPVHFISATDLTIKALSMGAVGFNVKPISSSDLNALFRDLFEKLNNGSSSFLAVASSERMLGQFDNWLSDDSIMIDHAHDISGAAQWLDKMIYDCIVLDFSSVDVLKAIQVFMDRPKRKLIPIIVYSEEGYSQDAYSSLIALGQTYPLSVVGNKYALIAEVTLFLHRVSSGLAEEQQEALKRTFASQVDLSKTSALVVDDDMRNVFALSAMLESEGMQLHVANNGKEAVTMLENMQDLVDIVFMDIMMPEMDGYEACQFIRQKKRFDDLPIIALTANAMVADREKCIGAGANDYMPKPVEKEKLLSVIRTWLSTPANTQF